MIKSIKTQKKKAFLVLIDLIFSPDFYQSKIFWIYYFEIKLKQLKNLS